MGLVEGILGKGRHFVENAVSHLRRDPVCHCAGTFHCPILPALAVNEVLPFCLHDVHLLFAHGLADQVRPAVGVPCQRPEHLHHLFLIEQATGGHP